MRISKKKIVLFAMILNAPPYMGEGRNLVMGGMYGVFRLIGAIGLLKNRIILAGSALILMLTQYFGDEEITIMLHENECHNE